MRPYRAFAYCTCGARLVPSFTGPSCPRLGSCGRGGRLEGTGIEIVGRLGPPVVV